jgi:hypothetical protein
MARSENGIDYYVFEPALAIIKDEHSRTPHPVMPVRWFQRGSSIEMWATCHRLEINRVHDSFIIDGNSCLDIPLADFRFSCDDLEKSHKRYKLPHPHKIEGTISCFHLKCMMK